MTQEARTCNGVKRRSSINGVGEMDRYMQENETKLPYHTVYKINSPLLMWLSGLSTGLQTKHHRLDSQGHMPGVWARSPVGDTREATTQMFLLLSPFPSNSK